MQIIINTTTGTVTINSSEALMLKQDQANQQHNQAMQAIGVAISDGLNSLTQDCAGEAGLTESSAASPTEAPVSAAATPAVITGDAIIEALRTLLSEDERYATRSAKAIAKKIGCEEDDIQGALLRLVSSEELNSHVRRSGEVVYSL